MCSTVSVELLPRNRRGSRGPARELLPAPLGADGAELQRQREELVNEDRPAARLVGHALDPALASELDERHGLEDGFGVFAEERHVRASSRRAVPFAPCAA